MPIPCAKFGCRHAKYGIFLKPFSSQFITSKLGRAASRHKKVHIKFKEIWGWGNEFNGIGGKWMEKMQKWNKRRKRNMMGNWILL
jgi:hypothetical protein